MVGEGGRAHLGHLNMSQMFDFNVFPLKGEEKVRERLMAAILLTSAKC